MLYPLVVMVWRTPRRRRKASTWRYSGCSPFSPVPRLTERTGRASQTASTSARERRPTSSVSR